MNDILFLYKKWFKNNNNIYICIYKIVNSKFGFVLSPILRRHFLQCKEIFLFNVTNNNIASYLHCHFAYFIQRLKQIQNIFVLLGMFISCR